MQLLAWLGITLVAIPLVFYALYPALLKTIAKGRELHAGVLDALPALSVVIPVYNECKMIEKRVKNFDNVEYPRELLHVIFVDGASTDGTPEIIEQLAAENRPYITVLRQRSRLGYNAGVYDGVAAARSDIVVVGEGGGILHEKALTSVVKYFANPAIGVVTGKPAPINPQESLATRMEAAYRVAHDRIRLAESIVDSTPDMKGELLAFRREIGLKLQPGETLPDNTGFDMAISYAARRLGWRAILDPDAVVYEYVPTTLRDRITVQIRRGTTFAGALWINRSMILNPRFGIFGLLIVPSRFLMLILFPWMLIIGGASLFFASLYDPFLGLLVLLLLGLGLAIRRIRYTLFSFIISQFALAVATIRLLRGRSSQLINTVSSCAWIRFASLTFR